MVTTHCHYYLYSVTLAATDGDVFRGFIMQARRITPTSDKEEPIGTFEPQGNTQQVCQTNWVGVFILHISCLF